MNKFDTETITQQYVIHDSKDNSWYSGIKYAYMSSRATNNLYDLSDLVDVNKMNRGYNVYTWTVDKNKAVRFKSLSAAKRMLALCYTANDKLTADHLSILVIEVKVTTTVTNEMQISKADIVLQQTEKLFTVKNPFISTLIKSADSLEKLKQFALAYIAHNNPIDNKRMDYHARNLLSRHIYSVISVLPKIDKFKKLFSQEDKKP